MSNNTCRHYLHIDNTDVPSMVVTCVEDDQEFESLNAAGLAYGLYASQINLAMRHNNGYVEQVGKHFKKVRDNYPNT